MSPGAWLRMACRLMGEFPSDVLVLDVETTGLRVSDDLVTEYGYALVEDGKLVKSGGVVIDWVSGYPDEWVEKLAARLATTKEHVEFRGGVATGNTYNMSLSKMREEGYPAAEAFQILYDLIRTCTEGGFGFVGHNGLRIDQPMIDASFQETLGPGCRFVPAPGTYHDTMALEKAVQTTPQIKPGENWDEFIRRGYYLGGTKVMCNLANHCARKYDLHRKHNLDMSKAHNAEFDAVLTHHLFEEFREIKGRP